MRLPLTPPLSGFWQTTDYANQPFYWMRALTVDSYEMMCRDVFSITTMPDTDGVNSKFGSDAPVTSNTVFVNGNVDPWHSLSVFTNATVLADDSVVPVFIDGTAHCGDMYSRNSETDIDALVNAHDVIAAHVASWLA